MKNTHGNETSSAKKLTVTDLKKIIGGTPKPSEITENSDQRVKVFIH